MIANSRGLLGFAVLIAAFNADAFGQSTTPGRCTPTSAPALDHAIIAVRDLPAATNAFRNAGFRIKAGRLHANGLLNNHIKFPDGTEIELMTVRGKPGDAMARRYSDAIALGDGGIYVALRASDIDVIDRHARSLGLTTRRSSSGAWQFLGFNDTTTAAMFFTSGGGAPQDVDSVFRHDPRATALAEVWIEGGPALERLLVQAGAADCGNASGPDQRSGRRFALQSGSIVIVPVRAGSRPRVLGAVLETPNLDARTIRPVPQFWIQYRSTQTSDVQAVHALWQKFERAYNAGDAATIGSLFTPTADRINGAGPLVSGRDSIHQGYAQLLARRAADPSAAPFRPRVTVRLIAADVAMVDGEWKTVRAGRDVAGRFVLLAVRTQAGWLFEAGRAWEFDPPSP